MSTESRKAIMDEIKGLVREMDRLDDERRRADNRIGELETLLPYCECVKCGSELMGGIWSAIEMKEAALVAGRNDYPCAFCDTPEQKAEMGKALDLVAR